MSEAPESDQPSEPGPELAPRRPVTLRGGPADGRRTTIPAGAKGLRIPRVHGKSVEEAGYHEYVVDIDHPEILHYTGTVEPY